MFTIPAPSEAKRCELVAAYTTPLKGSQDDCAICLENISNDNGITVSRCKHIYHKTCLSTWVEQSSSCPLCRQQIFDKTHAKREFVVPFDSGDFIISELVYQQWRENDEGDEEVKNFAAVVAESAAWGHVSHDAREELGVSGRVVTWF
jgi:hypothetical protein